MVFKIYRYNDRGGSAKLKGRRAGLSTFLGSSAVAAKRPLVGNRCNLVGSINRAIKRHSVGAGRVAPKNEEEKRKITNSEFHYQGIWLP